VEVLVVPGVELLAMLAGPVELEHQDRVTPEDRHHYLLRNMDLEEAVAVAVLGKTVQGLLVVMEE
jgi:hypothetical protein